MANNRLELDNNGGRSQSFLSNRICIICGVIMGILLLIHLIFFIVGMQKLSSVDGSLGYVSTKNTEYSLTVTNKGRAKKGELIFNEDFSTLNLDTWKHEITMSGGGNGEFQIYHNNRSNSYVKYGKLYIRPTLTVDKYGKDILTNGHQVSLGGGATADYCTNDSPNGCSSTGTISNPIKPILSARIRTLGSFSFKYGKVEAKAKIPTGDWLWPAIWLMPENNQYGGWPASGEIDILESRGNVELYQDDNLGKSRNIGVERVGSTLHFGPYWPLNGFEKAHFSKYSTSRKGFNEGFNLYQMEWTPEHIKFSVDNVEIGKVKPGKGGFWELGGFPNNIDNPWQYAENTQMAPFDQQFHLIINVAVGGTNTYFPDNAKGNVRKPWNNNSPQAVAEFWTAKDDWYKTWNEEDAALQVDYIRVWAL